MAEELAKYDVETVSLADVKKYIAPKATDKELFMFMGIAKAYGLNPLKRELHFIKYGDSPASIVVGYETYLKRAEKTGKLDGWEVKTDGKTATICIRRKDWKEPFVWTVERSEFDRGQANWKVMPTFMLKKVAIAQGFRLAFPVEMGGMPYIPEEINHGDSEVLAPPPLPDEKDVPLYPVPPEPVVPPPAPAVIKKSDPDIVYVTSEILHTEVKTGEKDGKKWTRYGVRIWLDNKEKMVGTFDKNIYESCLKEEGTGRRLKLGLRSDGKFVNLVDVSALEEPEREPGAEG